MISERASMLARIQRGLGIQTDRVKQKEQAPAPASMCAGETQSSSNDSSRPPSPLQEGEEEEEQGCRIKSQKMINQIGRVKEEDKGEDSDWDEVKRGEEGLYQQGCHLLRLGSMGGLKGREESVIEGQEIMEMFLSLPPPTNTPYQVQCSDPPQEDDGNQRAGLQQTMHKDNSCLSLPPPISFPSPDPAGLEVSIQEREGRVGGLHAEDSQRATYPGCDASRLHQSPRSTSTGLYIVFTFMSSSQRQTSAYAQPSIWCTTLCTGNSLQ